MGASQHPSSRELHAMHEDERTRHRAAVRLQNRVLELVRENDSLRERVASLMLEEPSKTAGLYAAIDELQRENTRLRGGLAA